MKPPAKKSLNHAGFSPRDVKHGLEAAVLAADLVGREGLELAVETNPCQYGTSLGNPARVVERELRVSVALDTEFLALYNELEAALEAAWLWTSGSVRHIYLKDYADASSTHKESGAISCQARDRLTSERFSRHSKRGGSQGPYRSRHLRHSLTDRQTSRR